MGRIWARARLGDPERRRVVEVDALVDTGATLTVVPRALANQLNLPITGRATALTADGVVEVDRTRVWIELEGRSEVVPAVVSDLVDRVLIGVTTLEVLGLQADPVTGRLREWTILLY